MKIEIVILLLIIFFSTAGGMIFMLVFQIDFKAPRIKILYLIAALTLESAAIALAFILIQEMNKGVLQNLTP